jgi:hypothetical protein
MTRLCLFEKNQIQGDSPSWYSGPIHGVGALSNFNSDFSGSSEELIDIENDVVETVISPSVQVTTTSTSSNSTTPSATANALGYKRVGVTESEARKHTINLQTRRRRLLEDQLENKKIESSNRQDTFERYLINAEENRLESEAAERIEERASEQNRML